MWKVSVVDLVHVSIMLVAPQHGAARGRHEALHRKGRVPLGGGYSNVGRHLHFEGTPFPGGRVFSGGVMAGDLVRPQLQQGFGLPTTLTGKVPWPTNRFKQRRMYANKRNNT